MASTQSSSATLPAAASTVTKRDVDVGPGAAAVRDAYRATEKALMDHRPVRRVLCQAGS